MRKKNYLKYIRYGTIVAFFLVASFLYNITQKNESPPAWEQSSVSLLSRAFEETKGHLLYVFVCGAVNNPGVYDAEDGARVFELIAMAGGFTESAVTDYLNMAEKVRDGEKLYVPTVDEIKAGSENTVNAHSPGFFNETSDPYININLATMDQLMTLPGIGEAKAKAIIQYRETNGRFSDISEIKNIPGIKEAVFEKIKDLIIAK
ncbi:MAG: helix-hairpin-helix domain-containing protein [Lachnospiraceae bacterium]